MEDRSESRSDSPSADIASSLRRSEERYRTFIQISAEGIWRIETDRPIPTSLSEDEQIARFYTDCYLAECNDAMARMYGFEFAHEITGARLANLLAHDRLENIAYLRAFIQSGYRLTGALSRERAKDGLPKYFSNSLLGVLENGALVRAWGTQQDITEQKHLEAQLRHQAEELSLVYEAGRLLGSTLDLDVVYRTLQRLVARTMDCDRLLVSRFDSTDSTIRCAYAWINGKPVDVDHFPAIALAPADRGLQSRVIRAGEPILINDFPAHARQHNTLYYTNAEGEIIPGPGPESNTLPLDGPSQAGRTCFRRRPDPKPPLRRLHARRSAHCRVFVRTIGGSQPQRLSVSGGSSER